MVSLSVFDSCGAQNDKLIEEHGLPARRHKVNCFRASEPRPYKLSDSIIHVLTHFFSEWGKPQEVIELPSDLDIVNVFIMK